MRTVLTLSLYIHLRFTPFVTYAGQALETTCLICLCGLTILNGQNSQLFDVSIIIEVLHLPSSHMLIVLTTDPHSNSPPYQWCPRVL